MLFSGQQGSKNDERKWKIIDALPEERNYFKLNTHGFHPINNQATHPTLVLQHPFRRNGQFVCIQPAIPAV
jgi:hypothetical protein